MRTSKVVMLVAVLVMAFGTQDAEAKNRRHHTYHRTYSNVSRSAAYADIVIDAETGEVIHETASKDLRFPASLTKMMTLYLTFQALDSGRLDLDQYLYVSYNAARQSPSKLGLRAGQRIQVEDAILGVTTESANDAAVVLAESLGGSEANFAKMMTRQAQAMGMARTRFRNASGLPNPYQVTTARDMAILGAALIDHFPEYYPYFGRESFTYAGVPHRNHNHLMDRYDGMDGIKTGYIHSSGYNLVSSVKRGGTRLVAVVFGGRSAVARDNRMARLLDQSFEAIEDDERRPLQFVSSRGEGDSGDEEVGNDVELSAKGTQVSSSEDKKAGQHKVSHSGGKWGVQIGAYSSPSVSRQVLNSLVLKMPNLSYQPEMQVEKVLADGSVVYRARLMALDEKTARGVCAHLNRQGKSCMTVEP
ncbi:MAG: D-alanyl-D-alanine carboxypeptidase family protein [Bdellovibrionales bacterium]